MNKYDLPNFKEMSWSVDTSKLMDCFKQFKNTFDPVSNSYGAEFFSDDYEQMTITKMTSSNKIRGKIDERNYTELLPEFKGSYIEEVLNNFKSPYTRVRFVVKKPGSFILPHMDYDATYSVRYFIPIKTNNWAFTAVERNGEIETQNLKEGKGIGLNFGKKQGGDFLFASSNPLWRASIETIDFMSLATVDYAGGIIITDWYSDNTSNESVKITIKFLTNEIRADALKIDLHKRTCKNSVSCSVQKINSDIENNMRDKILKKASLYEAKLKEFEFENAPEKKYPGDNR